MTRLVWPVYQTYSDGERVAWTGPENSDEPASVTTIGAAAEARWAWMPYATAAAVLLALVSVLYSLTVQLRARRTGAKSAG